MTRGSGQNAHNVGLLHDQKVLIVDFDFGARPLAKQHAIADVDIDRDELAGFVTSAGAHREDFALGGLFLGGVGNDDPALGLFLSIDTLDHDSVMQRAESGFSHNVSLCRLACRSSWVENASVSGPSCA